LKPKNKSVVRGGGFKVDHNDTPSTNVPDDASSLVERNQFHSRNLSSLNQYQHRQREISSSTMKNRPAKQYHSRQGSACPKKYQTQIVNANYKEADIIEQLEEDWVQ